MDSKAKDIWEFDEDSHGIWRWNIHNDSMLRAYSQGYKNKEDCVENAKRNGYTG